MLGKEWGYPYREVVWRPYDHFVRNAYYLKGGGMSALAQPTRFTLNRQRRRLPANLDGKILIGTAYRQLRRIKAVVDPDDVIRANQPVPPAR
jgi:hypothetical protein